VAGYSTNAQGWEEAVVWRFGRSEDGAFGPLSGPWVDPEPFGPAGRGWVTLPDAGGRHARAERIAYDFDTSGLVVAGHQGLFGNELVLWRLDARGEPVARSLFKPEGFSVFRARKVMLDDEGRVVVLASALITETAKDALLLLRYE
jgi:hypothetical protein